MHAPPLRSSSRSTEFPKSFPNQSSVRVEALARRARTEKGQRGDHGFRIRDHRAAGAVSDEARSARARGCSRRHFGGRPATGAGTEPEPLTPTFGSTDSVSLSHPPVVAGGSLAPLLSQVLPGMDGLLRGKLHALLTRLPPAMWQMLCAFAFALFEAPKSHRKLTRRAFLAFLSHSA